MLKVLKPFVPPAVRRFRKKIILNRAARRARELCAGMSVEQTFETVYQRNLWGGIPGEFYSGTGSDLDIAGPYCKLVREFIREHNVKSIVDLGCGDFRVSQNLLTPGISYTGIDVASSLIERNNRLFSGPDIRFRAGNAIDEPPPAADLCLIRQMLQHLSNQQILRIFANCHAIRWLLVSEHFIRTGSPHINTDKPHGPDTRAAGILLDKPPFNLDAKTLLEIPIGPNEVIRTVLIEQKPVQVN